MTGTKKLYEGEAEAGDLGCGSTILVCGPSELYKQNNGFQFSMDQIILESGPKILDAWSCRQIRSPEIWVPAPQFCR